MRMRKRQGVGGDEIDICRCECQHMGVPAVRDRCLTEEVREGPGFPGCLLCSPPIAQRNTLSEEQRMRGLGRSGGGVRKGGRWSQMPFSPGPGCQGLGRGAGGLPNEGPPPPTPAGLGNSQQRVISHLPAPSHCASTGECSHWPWGMHWVWEAAICRSVSISWPGMGGGQGCRCNQH